MDLNKYLLFVNEHYNHIWDNAPTIINWNKGPMNQFSNEFRVLEYPPTGLRKMWTYATCGMSSEEDMFPLELHMFSPENNEDIVELLTVVAYYHRSGSQLALGDTVNFGRPWLHKSKCEYGLLSLPYLDGPKLEWGSYNNKRIQFLWLIPITKDEVLFKKKNGIDALEELFDSTKFNYLNQHRRSVV